MIVFRYISTSAVVAARGGNPLFVAPGYLLHWGDDAKPVYPKSKVEMDKKMHELQRMAHKHLKQKLTQDRGQRRNKRKGGKIGCDENTL